MFFHLLPGFTPAFTWVGLGGDANWNTGANWSTGVVPGPGNTAIFDDTCVSNCDPSMNIVINVGGLNIKNSYAGTITQGVGNSVTVGASGWTQAGGTFAGSNAAINLNGPFTFSSGTVTATSGTWTQSAHFTKTGGTFNHNSGTLVFTGAITISPDGMTLFNATFTSNGDSQNLNAGTLNVASVLTYDSTSNGGDVNNGTINLTGNLNATGNGKGGSALVRFISAGAQSLSAASSSISAVEINKPGGTLTITGTAYEPYSWTWVAGTVDASASTISFSGTVTITPGPVDYQNITFTGNGNNQNLGGNTMKVLGNLTLDATSNGGGINNGIISARGSISCTGRGKDGSAIIKIDGTGAQSFTGVAGSSVPNVEIDKSSGQVNLAGTISTPGTWTWIAGTINAGASTVIFSGMVTITPGPATYNNITFTGNGTHQNLGGNAMSVGGTLTLDSTPNGGDVNNGTLNASGNVVFTGNGKGGTVVLNYVGVASTTLTVGASASTLGTTHNVAKTVPGGSLSLVANTNFSSAGRNFTITSGTMNIAGFTFAVNNLITISATGRLICNGGTATAASWSIIGEISCGTGQGITWTGTAGDNLWSTAGNWTNNTVPGASDLARFNASICVGAACNAQINSNLSVRGITLQSTYTGTLTQPATRTLTIGTAGFSQAAGTFAGGDSAISMSGPFALSGGTFTATSGTWTQSANMTFSGAPTFNHNSGTWTGNGSLTIVPNGVTFNNMNFFGSTATYSLSNGTVIAVGNVGIDDPHSSNGSINSGTIEVRGNVTTTAYGKSGSALIRINGTGPQTITGTSGYIPNWEINKAADTATLVGTITTTGNFSYLSGTLDAGTSTIAFVGGSATVRPGSATYNNVTFGGYQSSANLNGETMIVNGLLTITDAYSGPGNLNNGTIEARGNITTTAFGKPGTALVRINGTGAQIFNGVSGYVPSWEINKASGTLTLTGTIATGGSYSHLAGTVDASTSKVAFSGTTTIRPGSVIYNDVEFGGYQNVQNLNAETMIVTGSLMFYDGYGSGGGAVNNGTIEARGNIASTGAGKSGSALVRINGVGAQTLTGTSGTFPGIEINKGGGTLTMAANINTSTSWNWIAGTVAAGTSTVSINANMTIDPGPIVYNNFTFSGYQTVINLGGHTLTAAGTVTFADGYSSGGNNVDNGTIEAQGNVTTATNGKSGTAQLNYTGATNGTLTWTTGTLLSTNHNVMKTGGASVLLGSNVNFSAAGRDFNITSGTLDLAGYDFATQDVLTIGVGATIRCNGGVFTAGTLANSGTVNCPGYPTYEFNWTGSGGNSNWTTAGNWLGGVAPGVNDVPAFQDSTCGGNCNATINSAATIKGIRIFAPYSGTISQSLGNAITVGSRGWTQAGGTFTGSNANITLTGAMTLSAGIFNSTSATLRLGMSGICSTLSILTIGNTGIFNHNNGLVSFSTSGGWLCTSVAQISLTPMAILNNVEIDGAYYNGAYPVPIEVVTTKTAFVAGNINHISGGINGLWDLSGNLTVGTNANGGTGEIIFSSAGAQTYSSGASGVTAGITVNKASGSVDPFAGTTSLRAGVFNLMAGSFTAPSGILRTGKQFSSSITAPIFTINTGTAFNTNSGTVQLVAAGNWLLNPIATVDVPAGFAFNHLQTDGAFFNGSYPVPIRPASGTIQINGNLNFISGTMTNAWALAGNYTNEVNAGGGLATILFNGTGTQTITRNGGTLIGGAVTINKPSGSVVLAQATNFATPNQDLTITAGTLNMSGYNLTVARNISNSGTLQRGNNPTCGVVSQGGSFTGNAAVCP